MNKNQDWKMQDARDESDESDESDKSAGAVKNGYRDRAVADFWRGVLCMAGSALLALLCVAAAFGLAALWAVVCGACAVFCWFGAQVYFHDAALNRRKARWRMPDDH